MNVAIETEPIPVESMKQLAQRAQVASKQLKSQLFPVTEYQLPANSDLFRETSEGSSPKTRLYQFGIGVLASTFVGTAVNASEGATSTPSVSVDYIRQLAIAKQLVASAPEWETPTIEHMWTPESCRMRGIVREFNETIYADS